MQLNRKITLLIFSLVMMSCSVFDTNKEVVGTGPVESMDIVTADFDQIQCSGIADINVTQSDSHSITFNAQAEILEVMEWRVSQGKLILDFEDNVNIKTHKEVSIDIALPSLRSISSEGTGDITLIGDLQDRMDLDLTGTGSLYAYNQELSNCSILLTGTANAWIKVRDVLDADLTGTGNIYYKGNPSINIDITGTGRLIHQN